MGKRKKYLNSVSEGDPSTDDPIQERRWAWGIKRLMYLKSKNNEGGIKNGN